MFWHRISLFCLLWFSSAELPAAQCSISCSKTSDCQPCGAGYLCELGWGSNSCNPDTIKSTCSNDSCSCISASSNNIACVTNADCQICNTSTTNYYCVVSPSSAPAYYCDNALNACGGGYWPCTTTADCQTCSATTNTSYYCPPVTGTTAYCASVSTACNNGAFPCTNTNDCASCTNAGVTDLICTNMAGTVACTNSQVAMACNNSNLACATTTDCQVCGAGYICDAKVCASPAAQCTTDQLVCHASSDCQVCGSNYLCINQVCSNSVAAATACSNNELTCTSNTDCQACGADYICEAQVCVSLATQCAAGKITCTASSGCQACGSNYLCIDQACSDNVAAATACSNNELTCASSPDCQVCGTGAVCENHVCISLTTQCTTGKIACTASAGCQACGSNYLCINQACSDSTSATAACNSNNELSCVSSTDCEVCGTGYACADKLCMNVANACTNSTLPCQNNSDCQSCNQSGPGNYVCWYGTCGPSVNPPPTPTTPGSAMPDFQGTMCTGGYLNCTDGFDCWGCSANPGNTGFNCNSNSVCAACITDNTSSCAGDGDCCPPLTCGINNTCSNCTVSGAYCTTSQDCCEPLVCVGATGVHNQGICGNCIPLGSSTTCQFDSDCCANSAGQSGVCLNSTCVLIQGSCETTLAGKDCASASCTNGNCACNPLGTPCEHHSDCCSGLVCPYGQCAQCAPTSGQCQKDADCCIKQFDPTSNAKCVIATGDTTGTCSPPTFCNIAGANNKTTMQNLLNILAGANGQLDLYEVPTPTCHPDCTYDSDTPIANFCQTAYQALVYNDTLFNQYQNMVSAQLYSTKDGQGNWQPITCDPQVSKALLQQVYNSLVALEAACHQSTTVWGKTVTSAPEQCYFKTPLAAELAATLLANSPQSVIAGLQINQTQVDRMSSALLRTVDANGNPVTGLSAPEPLFSSNTGCNPCNLPYCLDSCPAFSDTCAGCIPEYLPAGCTSCPVITGTCSGCNPGYLPAGCTACTANPTGNCVGCIQAYLPSGCASCPLTPECIGCVPQLLPTGCTKCELSCSGTNNKACPNNPASCTQSDCCVQPGTSTSTDFCNSNPCCTGTTCPNGVCSNQENASLSINGNINAFAINYNNLDANRQPLLGLAPFIKNLNNVPNIVPDGLFIETGADPKDPCHSTLIAQIIYEYLNICSARANFCPPAS